MTVASFVCTATVQRQPSLPDSILRWALDLPGKEQNVDLAKGSLYVQGWMLQREAGATPPILLSRAVGSSDEPQRHAFNSGRPDVITRLLNETATGHPQLRCGFAVHLDLPAGVRPQQLDLGFDLGDGAQVWVARIVLRSTMQVTVGADGWLYLNNDTNRSVDQFTGVLQLDEGALAAWQEYFDASLALAQEVKARFATVVAPCKEEVLPQFYPHRRAARTVLDQVLALAQPEHHMVNAAALLAASASPEACMMKTDTHWTDRGALLAALAVLRGMDLPVDEAEAVFAGDSYELMPLEGDLGSKLAPPVNAPTEFLQAPSVASDAVFDNGMPNLGRTLVFNSPTAPWAKSLLMFGASSGYPMLRYFKRLFRRVVFVHSAGSVDELVVQHEQPDCLLLQSNGRFLIQPPALGYRLGRSIVNKATEKADPEMLKRLQALATRSGIDARDEFYYEPVRRAARLMAQVA